MSAHTSQTHGIVPLAADKFETGDWSFQYRHVAVSPAAAEDEVRLVNGLLPAGVDEVAISTDE
ncbi:hypothetical protein SAMN05216388_101761 [Halorientalis persicus]|uniref:Uncharacterized protein n=1 Tax=Halorientalis persicus TaxID=1367881 RepID=A0A1H8RWK4_9EURY|nr:hypothetical protein [Halorientalis persicus]SEO70735.1 hypothetical protein SAMN05216388_101761 [Halorientalis persicus]